jgi:hypothetical protein
MLTNDEAGISGRTTKTLRLTRSWSQTSFVVLVLWVKRHWTGVVGSPDLKQD